ncbi:MAG: PHP domain-containing protein, partial [Burkholderiaceae bacterium]
MKILQDLNVDLHTHSTASDGSLTPSQLVVRAIEHGGDILSLTDHDTVRGNDEGLEVAKGTSLTFIPGVEISTLWGGSCIHVVGLDIQFNNVKLKEALLQIQKGRFQRAERINLAL